MSHTHIYMGKLASSVPIFQILEHFRRKSHKCSVAWKFCQLAFRNGACCRWSAGGQWSTVRLVLFGGWRSNLCWTQICSRLLSHCRVSCDGRFFWQQRTCSTRHSLVKGNLFFCQQENMYLSTWLSGTQVLLYFPVKAADARMLNMSG